MFFILFSCKIIQVFLHYYSCIVMLYYNFTKVLLIAKKTFYSNISLNLQRYYIGGLLWDYLIFYGEVQIKQKIT